MAVVNDSLRSQKSQVLASLGDYNLESLWNDTLVTWVVFWIFLEHYRGILEFWNYDTSRLPSLDSSKRKLKKACTDEIGADGALKPSL